jgi:hypothetical protein
LANKGELTLAFVFAALGGLWVARAARMPVWGDSFAPDSGFLPLIYGALLCALSLAALAQVVGIRGPSPNSSSETIGKPLLVLGALAAAVAALPLAGFPISVFALLLFIYAVLERLPLLPALITSAAITGGLYLVFKVWLGVPLP